AAKPCRFYQDTGRCAKGDRCNLCSSVDLPDSASESDTTGSDHHEWQIQVEDKSECTGKDARQGGNYYPITWRVIGGGVMMSGSREICQDYISGRCEEGIDCKFSHPAAGDESEPVMISGFPPNAFYAPTSPLQLMPVPVFLQPPPLRHPRRNIRRAQTRTNDRLQRQKYPMLYDGSTLLPIDPSQDVIENTSEEETPILSPQSTKPRELLAPRAIERPMSTPPSTSAVTKMFRVSSFNV
ncbi:hypothetical protein BDY19DRAFT_894052, partial [Irpex rosettiformis]